MVSWILTSLAVAAPQLQLHALGGPRLARGIALDALGQPREPATKVSIPIEAGIGLAQGGGWIRAHAAAGVLLQGSFLYRGGGGLSALPVHFDTGLAGGGRIGNTHLGGLVGLQLPSRLLARGVLGWSPESGPWVIELRGGLQVPTERPPEPAVELLFGVWR